MLGQTCHPDLHSNTKMKYQEVKPHDRPHFLPALEIPPAQSPFKPSLTRKKAFVIHAIHSSLIVYYARLPNGYLSAIQEHGINYLQKVDKNKFQISLRATKVFHLRQPNERADIFTLLAKLIWYLVSGKSHVGYLHNHPDNPIHIAVSFPLL